MATLWNHSMIAGLLAHADRRKRIEVRIYQVDSFTHEPFESKDLRWVFVDSGDKKVVKRGG